MNWTEVTDVESIGNPTTVYLGRSRHYINSGDKLTFRGDTHPDILENGTTYEYVGMVVNESIDSVFLEDIESEKEEDRIELFAEDLRYYLLNGCFEIHDS